MRRITSELLETLKRQSAAKLFIKKKVQRLFLPREVHRKYLTMEVDVSSKKG